MINSENDVLDRKHNITINVNPTKTDCENELKCNLLTWSILKRQNIDILIFQISPDKSYENFTMSHVFRGVASQWQHLNQYIGRPLF